MPRHLLAFTAVITVTVAACGSPAATEAQRIETVAPTRAAEIIADQPDGLVVLDVRTPAEFDQGRLEGAVLVDYTAPGFADRVAELDRDVPYILYCRSGNRSAGAREVMRELGFAEVYEVEGGIVAWASAGLPVVTR